MYISVNMFTPARNNACLFQNQYMRVYTLNEQKKYSRRNFCVLKNHLLVMGEGGSYPPYSFKKMKLNMQFKHVLLRKRIIMNPVKSAIDYPFLSLDSTEGENSLQYLLKLRAKKQSNQMACIPPISRSFSQTRNVIAVWGPNLANVAKPLR